jgi:hypothetical protein
MSASSTTTSHKRFIFLNGLITTWFQYVSLLSEFLTTRNEDSTNTCIVHPSRVGASVGIEESALGSATSEPPVSGPL